MPHSPGYLHLIPGSKQPCIGDIRQAVYLHGLVVISQRSYGALKIDRPYFLSKVYCGNRARHGNRACQ